jgi:hypothetical protein
VAKKKSVKRAAQLFQTRVDELDQYCAAVQGAGLTKQQVTWAVEVSLIKLSASFEQMVLDALVGAINNDTSTLSTRTGVAFPKHLTDEVCEYIVVGSGYFDFRGRGGLIQVLRDFLPDSHYLLASVKKAAYKKPIEQLIALRNFAAHESPVSKRKAREAVGTNMSAPGAWLKRQNRFSSISAPLKQLAAEIETGAPF